MRLSPQIAGYEICDLKALLKDLQSISSEKGVEEFKALVAALGRREEMIRFLRGILSDSAALAEVADRSYPHVNNFDKIVLVGSSKPDAYRLTLHLWRPPYSYDVLSQELIHDHRFNFWSTILTGVLSSEVFLKCRKSPGQRSNARKYRQYKYIPEADRTTDFTEFYTYQGHVNLLSMGIQHRLAGETYYLDAPTIHRIVLPQSNIACTLVLRGPRLRDYSCVFNTDYPSHDIARETRMFSVSDLAGRLCQLVTALECEQQIGLHRGRLDYIWMDAIAKKVALPRDHMPVTVELAETLLDDWYRIDRYLVSQAVQARTEVPAPSRFPRLVCARGDRVAVLPYRRSDHAVVLVQQFRLPVFLAEPEGDGISIEVPGGLIGSDSPEGAARREVLEEAGLTVNELEVAPITFCYPVLVMERTYLFLAPMDVLAPNSLRGGIHSEGEDTRILQMTLQTALGMVADRSITDAKTVMALYHLARRTP